MLWHVVALTIVNMSRGNLQGTLAEWSHEGLGDPLCILSIV